ncbi:MAG TPA: TonB-dependent receptor [Bryobacteraceae bacterium]|nr:TonB-dependent receptor [Bryobacteraceae bacterium]
MSRLSILIGAALLFAPPCQPGGQEPADRASQDLTALTLEELTQVRVEGAALHSQTLEDAPASVTIISAEDIRKYGYRTLGEALSAVRGFYMSNNRTYETVGVRGFNLPGDYSSHVLVMVNGHNMSDNVFDFMLFFGNDFPIDMNLIKQIEIIRGPASALYGSNAMFATINIVTKSPSEMGPLTFTGDTGSFGEKKGQLTASASLGGAKVLFSGSVFNNSGESPLYFPQYNTPQTNYGNAIDMNGEQGYHFFSSLVWRNWTVTAAFAGHDKIQPISWGPTIFNDRGTQNDDNRDFIDAVYARQIAGGTLRWRTYYDSYHYLGRFDYPLGNGGVEDNRQNTFGNWIGTQVTYRLRPSLAGDITVGVEGKVDLRNLQTDGDVSPAPIQYLSTSNRDRSLALFAQDEKQLSQRWKLDLGLRFDESSYRSDFVSPRAALIYQRSEWTYKLLYGRSFRNPSAFQLFYSDGLSGVGNPNARPERADTVEVDVERKLGQRMNLQVSAYGYRLRNFLEGVYLADGLLQYQNIGRIQAEGFELEINGRPANWLEATASYAVQQSRDDAGLENSPGHLAKLRFAVPLGRKFDLSSGMQYESSRLTLAGASLTPAYLADFTVTSKHLLPNLDVRLGLRNAFNRNYSDPIALNPLVDSMVQPGRSFFVELIAHPAR